MAMSNGQAFSGVIFLFYLFICLFVFEKDLFILISYFNCFIVKVALKIGKIQFDSEVLLEVHYTLISWTLVGPFHCFLFFA